MPESIIQALCKIPVHSNAVSQHLLPILYLHIWEHNTIVAHKAGITSGSLTGIPEKRTVSTLSLLSQVPNQEHPRSSMTWNEFNLCNSSKTVHCIFITNHTEQLCISLLPCLQNCKYSGS